ncbi:MAG: response regulator [Eubacteriales bacterium]|nr:response regulator [Eubacteriales bacterium]
MAEVIVVFPNKDNATNIRNILTRGGCKVIGVCTTGAQALHYTELLDEGIVVCGYKLPDMLYTELREYLPKEFEMLLIASPDKWRGGAEDGVVGLSMPIKLYDLMNTMEMMQQTMDRRRRRRKKERQQRNPEQEKLIRKAKELLMARNNMSEEEAHRYLQKCSMDSGTNIVETAEMVLSVMSE